MSELPFYHSFAGKVPAVSTELAERLIGIGTAGMGKVLFANSGRRRTTPRSSWRGTSTTRSAGRRRRRSFRGSVRITA
jgi:hypothetical protein